MIVDAHAHIFPKVQGLTASGPVHAAGYGRVKVGAEIQQLLPPYQIQTRFTPEMLIANLDWAGVDQAVLLQGPFYGECNDYVLDALQKFPHRLMGLAYLDPWEQDARSSFYRIKEQKAFKGVKLECSQTTGLTGLHPSAQLSQPEIAWLWDGLERSEMVLVLDLGAIASRSYQTEAVRVIAAAHPGLKIVIAHLGQPRPEAEQLPEKWALWKEQIDLGLLANIWFDCAALPAYLPSEEYPFVTAGRYLQMAVDRIGPAKILWGSDQPGLLAHAKLPQLVAMIKTHIAYLPAQEQALILGKNAELVYGSKD